MVILFDTALPGFYFDAEKNRYFPIKNPIPGSSSKKPKITTPKSPQTDQVLWKFLNSGTVLMLNWIELNTEQF